MAILNTLFYDPKFSPAKKEIERGEYRSYGFVVGEVVSGKELFIFENKNIANITVFTGKDTVSFKDSLGVERCIERTSQKGQMVFHYQYEEDVPLARVKADLSVFVDAIKKEIDEYIRYCMTHDD
jgi:hypothetical protein